MAELPVLAGLRCPICARRTAQRKPCGRCQSDSPAFDSTWSPLDYAGSAVSLIHAFKFGGDLAAGLVLADTMLRERGDGFPKVDCLLPVPLHPGKLRHRGFNQSVELARRLGSRMRIPTAIRAARRVREGPSQSGLRGIAPRRHNVRGVFHVEHGALTGRRIALVDDVMASGATASEMARCLKQAGAREVHAWVAARAE